MKLQRTKRGTVILLVVGLLVIIAILGSSFLLISHMDRQQSAAISAAAPMDHVARGILDMLVADRLADLHIDANGPYGAVTDRQQTIDYPGETADKALADFESTWGGSEAYWHHITNIGGVAQRAQELGKQLQGGFSPTDLVDTDGDGGGDSLLWNTGTTNSAGEEYWAAVRMIDASGLVNVNTATGPANAAPSVVMPVTNVHPRPLMFDCRPPFAPLKEFMMRSGADAAAFQEIWYFQKRKEAVTHKWTFAVGAITLSDCLAGPVVPGASGNYMFTKESWLRAGGYPEFAGALDAWGFGFQQLAAGCKMVVMPSAFYYHRYGHDSYWVRDSRGSSMSLKALQLMIPFFDLISEKDVDRIMSRKGRRTWFERLEERPIRVKSGHVGQTGKRVPSQESHRVENGWLRNNVRRLRTLVRSRALPGKWNENKDAR